MLLTQTRGTGEHRSPALGWGAATLVLGAATVLAGGWVWLQASSYDIAEDCALRLGVAEYQVAWSEVAFPPQLWCLSGDAAEALVPAWADAVLVLGVAATIFCALAAVRTLADTRASARSLLVVCVVVALGGVGGGVASLAQQPSAEALERAHVAATATPGPSPTPEGTSGASSAPPTVQPTTTASAATSTLAELSRIAKAQGTALVWPQAPGVTASGCTLPDGRSGSVLSLTGRFTTKDMAQVHGPAEVLEVSQANELVAQRLVDDWLASGLLAGVDRLHGEWYLGSPAGGAVESAHVGFTEAVGELRVLTYCAAR